MIAEPGVVEPSLEVPPGPVRARLGAALEPGDGSTRGPVDPLADARTFAASPPRPSPPRPSSIAAHSADDVARAADASSATTRGPSLVYAACKRASDLLGAALGMILTGPLLALLALLVRLQDGGPAFVVQERVGQHGRRFRCYKLRTMTVDAPARRAALAAERFGGVAERFKLEHDPRVTPLGRTLRRWSLDELPQLANVARGDMSLVGPRPLLPDEVAQHDARARGRLAVRPGLTCFWQVSGRSLLPFERQLDLDLEYVARRSVVVDLLLLARTIPAVLSGRGAF